MVMGCRAAGWQRSCLPGWLAPFRPLKLMMLHFLNRRGQHESGQRLPTPEQIWELEAKLSFQQLGRKRVLVGMAKAQVSERLVGLGLETGLQSLGLDDFLPKAGQRIGLGAAPCVWFWLLLSNVKGTGNSLSLQGGTDRMNTHTHAPYQQRIYL